LLQASSPTPAAAASASSVSPGSSTCRSRLAWFAHTPAKAVRLQLHPHLQGIALASDA